MHNVQTNPGRAADSGTGDYHAHHDPSGTAKLSTTVIHALADAMGENVTDVGFSLYDSVDPDALDRIFAVTTAGHPRSPGHVAFTVDGYQVTVYSSGDIVITPPAPSPPTRGRA